MQGRPRGGQTAPEGVDWARGHVRALNRRCDVLFDQRAPELRLTADELHAVRFERPPACARRPQILALTDELADPFSQALDVGDIHHQQGRSERLSIACGNAEESSARCDLIAHGTAVDERGLWKAPTSRHTFGSSQVQIGADDSIFVRALESARVQRATGPLPGGSIPFRLTKQCPFWDERRVIAVATRAAKS